MTSSPGPDISSLQSGAALRQRSSGAELQQLRCAAESWAKERANCRLTHCTAPFRAPRSLRTLPEAAEESRRELRDREQRLEETVKPCCRGTEGRREICRCLQELLTVLPGASGLELFSD